MVLITPTSIVSTGTGNSSSIGANGSVTFSSCATLSLNGVFSSSYDNYVAIFRASSSTAGTWNLRLRASGTDNNTTSSYTQQDIVANNTSITANRYSDTWFPQTLIDYAVVPQNGSQLFFYGPFLAQPTALRTTTAWTFGNALISDRAYTHNQSTSYDGFSIVTTSGTTNGVISVYGLVGA